MMNKPTYDKALQRLNFDDFAWDVGGKPNFDSFEDFIILEPNLENFEDFDLRVLRMPPQLNFDHE